MEEWLNDFLRTHQKTIHQCIRKSVEKMNYEDFNLHKFIEQEIAQLGLLLLQIIWTKRSEKALQDTSINKNILNETNKYFLEMLNQFIDKTTCRIQGNPRRNGMFHSSGFEQVSTIEI